MILQAISQKGSRVEKVMMTLVQTTMLQKSRYRSNFLLGRAKCFNSRLGPAKISAELLGSRMKSKNLLAPGMSFSWYRNCKEEFTCYFQRLIPLYFAQIFLG